MARAHRQEVKIGTAGWAIPRASTSRFDADGTHLQRYARRFRCVEINSSFHRPHSERTYAKWRDSTPADFQFSVKLPRLITHTLKLRDVGEPFVTFLTQTAGLAAKRGPLLVQLPPSLAFDETVATRFFDEVRAVYAGPLVCEPRHASWFTRDVAGLLDHYRAARVVADPAPEPEAASAGGWPGLVYVRLHGSPRTYWSRYDEQAIADWAAWLRPRAVTAETWCVFDNTASGAAIENAWEMGEMMTGERM